MDVTNGRNCTPTTVKVHRHISVLPNDYSELENIPSINGIRLIGEQTAKQLNLLSAKVEDYETVSVESAQDKYVLIIGKSGEQQKISLLDLTANSGTGVIEGGSGFTTSDTVDDEMAIGTYQFVLKE